MAIPSFPSRVLRAGLLSAMLALPAFGLATAHAQPATGASAPATPIVWTLAEVRRIDRGSGKITLRHEEIRNLDMPPMTMVFQVKSATMLDGLEAGARVRFAAAKLDGVYTVIELEPVR